MRTAGRFDKLGRPRRSGGSRERAASSVFVQSAGAPNDLRGLLAAMRRYLEHRGVMGATEVGLYNLEHCLREFIIWADGRGVTHPQQVTRPVLERYQRHLHHYRKKNGEPLSLRSQRNRVVPLKSWFKWLTKSAELDANPAADLELPRAERRVPRAVLTAEEAERVLVLPDLTTAIGVRDRTLMEVLYATGVRRQELARLAIDDIDRERATVLVREGKGRRDRLLPLGERALHWVQHYLEQARAQLAWDANERALFLGVDGRALSPNWLSITMGQYIKRAGLGKSGSCHLWRHTMATLMLEGGADIRFIQAMLGHELLSTTQIYTQVAIRQLQAVHAMTHPGAQRRVRASQKGEDVPAPQPDAQNAAQALVQALAREADEEANDDRAGGVAADA